MIARNAADVGIGAGICALVAALLAPLALGALTGGGQLTDVVSLTTTSPTIPGSVLMSTAGGPAAPASSFTVTNGNSNVGTLIRYAWSTVPYYGATSSQTTINLHGTTYYISDLLWFKQSVTDGAGTTTTSETYSPLLVKNAASVARVTWSQAGNACTGWTGSAAGGFSAAAAGSFTFKYYSASSQTDNAPGTSDTFHYCLDVTNSQVYLGKSAAYASATLVKSYTDNSALGSLKTYQYEFLSGSEATGNRYCLTGITGSGTSATPDLAMCQSLGYNVAGTATARLYPLFDPPAYFPSLNQLGSADAVTYAMSGTQWNPYAYTTTNSA